MAGRIVSAEDAKKLASKFEGNLASIGGSTLIKRTPQMRQTIYEIMENADFNPAKELCESMHKFKAEFEEEKSKGKIDFKETCNFYRIYVNLCERMAQYQYQKAAIVTKSQKTNVVVDMTKQLEKLDLQMFGDGRVDNFKRDMSKVLDSIKTNDTFDDAIDSVLVDQE